MTGMTHAACRRRSAVYVRLVPTTWLVMNTPDSCEKEHPRLTATSCCWTWNLATAAI